MTRWIASRATALVLLGMFTGWGAEVLLGQDNPNTARGEAAAPSLTVGEIDSVNLFNGNLSLSIPIGQQYPVGGGFSYSLQLTYNSNVWRLEQRGAPGCDPDLCNYLEALPDADFNAGLGWQLHLGQVRFRDSRWNYTAPDGSQVTFYTTLHEGESDPDDWYYSRDGSYLRLNDISAAQVAIHFPDGRIGEFTKDTSVLDDPAYFLTRLSDPQGNWLAVQFSVNRWTLTDSAGRTHYVDFVAGTQRRRVSVVDLTAFSGARARWNFSYSSVAICRSGLDSYPANSSQVTVPLLTGVAGPDSLESWSMLAGNPPQPAYETGSGACVDESSVVTGVLQRIVLPTQGVLSWQWGWWGFWTSGALGQYSRNLGVTSKTATDPFGLGDGVWTYQTGALDPARRFELTRDVTAPNGTITRHYFAVPAEMNDSTFRGWEYALSFSPHRILGTDPENPNTSRYLSRQVFRPANNLLRSHYLRFAHDILPPVLPPDQQRSFDRWHNTNRRLVASREVYNREQQSDPEATTPYWRGTEWSDYDGLGHYRQQATQSNFSGSVERSERTQFNAARGCYEVDSVTNTQTCTGANAFVPIPTASPWRLGLFTYQSQSAGGVTARQDFQFATNGLLDCTRVRASSGAVGPNDLVTVNTHDASGNRLTETFLGGDLDPLAATDTCAPNSLSSYALSHTYQAGTRATSRHLFSERAEDLSPINFLDLNLLVDSGTGLPSMSTDPSGVQTAFSYDKLSRRITTTPQGTASSALAWTKVQYAAATPGVAAKVTVSSCPPGITSCNTPLAQVEYQYDGFGRLARERRLRESGLWSSRFSEFDGLGGLGRQSTWTPEDGSPFWTEYLQKDAFNRPQKIVPPDDPDHAIDIAYLGDREVTRFVPIASPEHTAETEYYTTEAFDDLGRLVSVQQQLDATRTQKTTYTYDVGGRLAAVNQKRVSGSTGAQNRYFNYDLRGLLLSEQHPEKGVSGNGLVRYSGFDARGHYHRKEDGDASRATLYSYDSAERLRAVHAGDDGDALKAWEYDTAPGSGQGKVARARSWTWIWTGADTVVETEENYYYYGRGGLPSQRHTIAHINGSDWDQFNQYFSWHALGAMDAESAPTWAFGPSAPLTTWYGYANGYLTGVATQRPEGTPLLASLGYRTNLTLGSIHHSNGVTDLFKLDDYRLQRPKRIQTTGVANSQNFDSGMFAFDGAGNVAGIGTDVYRYDGFSRLLSANLMVSGSARAQSYVYDSFGNITGITTGGSSYSTPTDQGTNRLSGSASYDASGNLRSYNGTNYIYDRLNRLVRTNHPGVSLPEDWLFAYTADDERIVSFCLNGESQNLFRWTPRGLDGKVRREFRGGSATADVYVDYFYANGSLLAADYRTGTGTRETRHFTLDHLGSPRIVTNAAAVRIGEHEYFPYGEEATTAGGTLEALRFTGHERDFLANGGGQPAADDLDYLHARFRSPLTGRFLSVDPVLQAKRAQKKPQLWNRYSYALGNPLVFTDPTGETVYLVSYTTGNTEGDDELRRAALTQAAAIRAQEGFDPGTDTVLVRGVGTKSDFAGALKDASGLEATFGKVGQVSLFSHSGPADGPVFHDSSGRATQFRPTELQGLGVNWESGASARFYGCNTAPNFTSAFSSAQGVTSYGYSGYAYFTSDPSRRVNPGEAGPVYMIQAPGLENGGTLGALKYLLGRAYAEPMTRTDP